MVSDHQLALCPIHSPSSGHYRADGSCRCRTGDAVRVEYLISNARGLVDGSGIISTRDRLITDLTEIADAYREVLVNIAGESYQEREKALRILASTGAEGPVKIPASLRGQFPGDRTYADRKARLRRALRRSK